MSDGESEGKRERHSQTLKKTVKERERERERESNKQIQTNLDREGQREKEAMNCKSFRIGFHGAAFLPKILTFCSIVSHIDRVWLKLLWHLEQITFHCIISSPQQCG